MTKNIPHRDSRLVLLNAAVEHVWQIGIVLYATKVRRTTLRARIRRLTDDDVVRIGELLVARDRDLPGSLFSLNR